VKIGEKRFKNGKWEVYTDKGWKVEAPKKNEVKVDNEIPEIFKDIFGGKQ